MDTPNLWFLQNCKMHNFCKCGTRENLESRRKDLYSNVFIKVRFSFSRHCNKYLLWSLTVSYQARQTPARKKIIVGLTLHQGVCHGIGIGTSGFKYWKLQTSEEEKIFVIKHQTKKESQMVLCVFHLRSPAAPQSVYTVAFVYLLSFLQDRCLGIMLIQFKLYASLYGSGAQNQRGDLRSNWNPRWKRAIRQG